MGKITMGLLRKRCEHNDGLIHNLEELTLHQDNLESIENIDKWCKDLKILYLQSNAISKIENLNRLKCLEYLNLALNNIERVENLDGCESLRKLDLTANFIGDLISIENLRENYLLEELFLIGNPCAEFEGYRDFVISTLPHLNLLDGKEICKTERLKALQNFPQIKAEIIKQQNQYQIKRNHQKDKNLSVLAENDKEEWEKMPWSPEYRMAMTRHREDKSKVNNSGEELKPEKPIKFFDTSGVPLNINQLRANYRMEEENGQIILDVPVHRYLDTSLIDVKIETTFVRINIKGKFLQLRFSAEVSPDAASAQRSTTTGNLRLILPFVKGAVLKSTKTVKMGGNPNSPNSPGFYDDLTVPPLI